MIVPEDAQLNFNVEDWVIWRADTNYIGRVIGIRSSVHGDGAQVIQVDWHHPHTNKQFEYVYLHYPKYAPQSDLVKISEEQAVLGLLTREIPDNCFPEQVSMCYGPRGRLS